LNKEGFYDKEDFLNEIIEDKNQDNIKIYVAEKIEYSHKDFIDSLEIMENISNNAYDIGSEYSENYCIHIEENKHIKKIEKLILEYFKKNIPEPTFYGIGELIEKDLKDIL